METYIFDKSNSNPHETVACSDRNPLGINKKKMNNLSKKAIVIGKLKKDCCHRTFKKVWTFPERTGFLENSIFVKSFGRPGK